MRYLRWLTHNSAETSDGNDPELDALVIPLSLAEAMQFIEMTVKELPRWTVVSIDHAASSVHMTRKTRLFKFVDDIHIRLEEKGEATHLHARSGSRIGKGDFGQNRRNLVELFKALNIKK